MEIHFRAAHDPIVADYLWERGLDFVALALDPTAVYILHKSIYCLGRFLVCELSLAPICGKQLFSRLGDFRCS